MTHYISGWQNGNCQTFEGLIFPNKLVLLHYAGSEIADIFDTFPEKDKGKDDDYSRAAELLSEYFLPKKNIEYETRVFRQAKQMTGKTIDRFHTHLRKFVKKLSLQTMTAR
jgi:hypothetical protein